MSIKVLWAKIVVEIREIKVWWSYTGIYIRGGPRVTKAYWVHPLKIFESLHLGYIFDEITYFIIVKHNNLF